jgi:hypothetical protein
MILDANGRELRRAIGFGRGLRVVPAKEPKQDAVGYQTVELDIIHVPLAKDTPPVEGEL